MKKSVDKENQLIYSNHIELIGNRRRKYENRRNSKSEQLHDVLSELYVHEADAVFFVRSCIWS